MMNTLFHVIKDPVHGTMQFPTLEDRWIKPFIDSPNFQRLRHIKQLGMGDFIFPGAVHTRFNHCLGCCYVASQIAHKIGLAAEERQLVMIACLLHDIGHGPFSHTFEGVFYKRLIRHEDWTEYFLRDYITTDDFFSSYNQLNAQYPLTRGKFAIVAQLIKHRPSTCSSVLSDIVSSQLDADRLDYLLRDSHFCGVKYGEFDFRWMLQCMTVIASPQGDRLGVTYKGIGVVEHYVMARRLMIRNIYHAQKKLALEFLLVQLLMKLADNVGEYAPLQCVAETSLGQFLVAVNRWNHTVKEDEKHLSGYKQEFLEKHYNNYKKLCDYDVLAVIKLLSSLEDTHAVVQIAQRLENRCIPKVIRLQHGALQSAQSLVDDFKLEHRSWVQDWQIAIISTPHQAYSAHEDQILVINEHKVVKTMSDMSVMIQAISGKQEHISFLCIDQNLLSCAPVLALIQTILHESRAPGVTAQQWSSDANA